MDKPLQVGCGRPFRSSNESSGRTMLRWRRTAGFVALFLACMTSIGTAQEPGPSPTASPSPTVVPPPSPTPATEAINLEPWQALTLIVFYVIVIAFVAVGPWLYDIRHAYTYYGAHLPKVIEGANRERLTFNELKALLKEVGSPVSGIQGLARTSLATVMIVVLGIGFVHVVLLGTRGPETAKAMTPVFTLIGGLVATIVGFYFGGRTATEAQTSASDAAKKATETATEAQSAATEATKTMVEVASTAQDKAATALTSLSESIGVIEEFRASQDDVPRRSPKRKS
jgi:hypothetical protein